MINVRMEKVHCTVATSVGNLESGSYVMALPMGQLESVSYVHGRIRFRTY